jgi:hypothetical protein
MNWNLVDRWTGRSAGLGSIFATAISNLGASTELACEIEQSLTHWSDETLALSHSARTTEQPKAPGDFRRRFLLSPLRNARAISRYVATLGGQKRETRIWSLSRIALRDRHHRLPNLVDQPENLAVIA